MPGERAWIKTKNREYWRYELEREGAIQSRTDIEALAFRLAKREFVRIQTRPPADGYGERMSKAEILWWIRLASASLGRFAAIRAGA
jgi:hypothetical protein